MDKQIPYFSHEGDMARMERTNRRLFIIIIILIAALLGTNAAWLYYENQFTETKVEIEADQETSDGNNYVVGGNMNGEAESQNDN